MSELGEVKAIEIEERGYANPEVLVSTD